MRTARLCILPLAAVALVACADHLDALEYDDAVETAAPEPNYSLIPDAAPAFQLMPEFDPGIETPSLHLVLEDEESCGYSVETRGMPAVSQDGHRVAYVLDDPPGGADGWVLGSDFVVVSYDRDDRPHGAARELLEGWGDRFAHPEGDRLAQCRAYAERLRSRIEEYNEVLTRYRPMAPLDVIADARPGFAVESALDLVDPESLAPQSRPVVARWRAGWFTLRVPGVRVVMKQDRADWLRPDEFCDEAPHLQAVYGDRTSGRGLVLVDYVSGGCLCDDGQYFEPITFDASVFETIDAFPTAPYQQAVDEVDPYDEGIFQRSAGD